MVEPLGIGFDHDSSTIASEAKVVIDMDFLSPFMLLTFFSVL